MKKYEIIKKNIEFNDIINTGKLLKNKIYIIYYKDSEVNFPKFGLAISKKFGNAVNRNRAKRQIRAILDMHKENIVANQYIIMIRKDFRDASYQEKEEYLVDLLSRKGL